ncbi:MAG: FAD-binding protein [Gemmatimonadetes bacterium]|nr:FAD-binding protein [Gemmatimonadota bacterium]
MNGRRFANQSLAPHTRYRIGGTTPCYRELSSEAEAIAAVRELDGRPYKPMGGGANLLVSDAGVTFPVLALSGELRQLEVTADAILASGGTSLPMLVQTARREARRDFHYLEAVPGTVGGALRMNAGTRDWGIWEAVEWTDALYPGSPHVERLTAAEVHPSYRATRVPEGTVFLRCRLRAPAGDAKEIRQRHLDYRHEKVANQPYDYASCGSVWKNPPGESVWRLIDAAGMRSARRGGAQISELHANFILNIGDAKADDVIWLMLETRRRVRERFNIGLVPEVRLWGFDADLLRELGAEDQIT